MYVYHFPIGLSAHDSYRMVFHSIMHILMFNISLLCVQGAIAKKPYNPILGETFRCYWDLPDGRRKPPDEESKVCSIPIPPLPHPTTCLSLSLSLCLSQSLLQSGPVPYASYSSVAFVAEQVSHHPPGTSESI